MNQHGLITIGDFPQPPPDREGWPWTVASCELFAETQRNGRTWPKITVITPSFNQGEFIEETIRSVILQRYPNLEFFVVDGGSTDSTVSTLRKYDRWITKWVSNPDGGQSDAINKGLSWGTGDWVNWINSDDWFDAGAFSSLASHFESDAAVVYGVANFTDADGSNRRPYASEPFSLARLLAHNYIGQPATFFRRRLVEQYGPLRSTLNFILDYELWLRWALAGEIFVYEPNIVAYYRLHSESKSTKLIRTNQRETVELLDELCRAGKIDPAVVSDRLRGFADWNYARRDLKEFRRNVNDLVARFGKRPSARLMKQYGLSYLGENVLGRLRAAKGSIQEF